MRAICYSLMGWIVDPEGFWTLVQTLPWHADTLLQLAEVYRHREGLYRLRFLGRMYAEFFL
jgi:hypothetical protein